MDNFTYLIIENIISFIVAILAGKLSIKIIKFYNSTEIKRLR